MTLIVARHGESLWNKENRLSGWIDIELSESGIQEAIQLGELLKKYSFDLIFTSDLKRATQSVGYAMKNSAYLPTSILRERHYGDLSGLTKDEIKEKYGEEPCLYSYEYRPPNGESLADVEKRVGFYFDQTILPLLKQSKNILIVAHGDLLRALMVHLNMHTKESIKSIIINNAVPLELFVHKSIQ